MTNNPYDNFDDPYANDDLFESIDRAAGVEPENKSKPSSSSRASGAAPRDYEPKPVTGDPGYGAGPAGYGAGQYPSAGGYGTDPGNPFLRHDNPRPNFGHVPVPYRYQAGPPELVRYDGMLKANVWLSAFVPIAGVIFYFVEKGKHPHYDKYLKESLNMSLTRIIVGAGAAILPSFLGGIAGLAVIAYFILAIIGASQASPKFLRGEEMRFKGAIPFTRD